MEHIKCPLCNTTMEQGSIVGRSPGVKFKSEVGILGDLVGVQLTSGIFNHSAPALRCNDCGTVVIPKQ